MRATLAGMNSTGVAALVVLLVLLSGLRIAREYQRAVVFRLGRYTGLRGPGLFWLIPLGIENETRIDLRVVTAPIEQQETITRDSVTVKVNAVLWYRVSDPQKAVLNVENFRIAVQQVALTSLRNVIGQHDLDEVLKAPASFRWNFCGIFICATSAKAEPRDLCAISF